MISSFDSRLACAAWAAFSASAARLHHEVFRFLTWPLVSSELTEFLSVPRAGNSTHASHIPITETVTFKQKFCCRARRAAYAKCEFSVRADMFSTIFAAGRAFMLAAQANEMGESVNGFTFPRIAGKVHNGFSLG